MDTLYLWIALALGFSFLRVAIKREDEEQGHRDFLAVPFGSPSRFWFDLGFIGHAFMTDYIAYYIGWPTGSPFQFEVAVANLSYGILGVLCAKYRGNFWTATVVAFSTFYFGAAYGHIVNMLENANYAPGNAGDLSLPRHSAAGNTHCPADRLQADR